MCMDFTDLNKCCLKDDFPFVRIDKIVDSTARCKIMVLLDYFWGYHQIWLHREDKEKTIFITPLGTYCYLIMPEGLCNVGPTFCRMLKAAFKDQVGRNVLSYIDDIVVVSKEKASYIFDLQKPLPICEKPSSSSPQEMRFWSNNRQGTQLSGLYQRHQSQPRQNKGNPLDVASVD
jgi:hypothetical protein